MSVDLSEQIDFIGQIPPFDQLPKIALVSLVSFFSINYLRQHDSLQTAFTSARQSGVFVVVRKGIVQQKVKDAIRSKYGEGDVIVINNVDFSNQQKSWLVDEDALVYSVPLSEMKMALADYPDILSHWLKDPNQRIHDSVAAQQLNELSASPLNSMTVEEFAHTPAATIEHLESIQSAAIKMTKLGYSSLVITKQDDHVGIITDKDIRSRAVAAGLELTTSVNKIMTTDMLTIEAEQIAFDGLLTMIEQGIHHLPVTKSGKLYGMLTLTDLMHKEGQNAAHLTSAIRKATSVSELARIGQMLPQLQVNLTKLGIAAAPIAKSISALSRGITTRLIQLAEQKLGSPSVPFAWLCAGSLARSEQLAFSDQDNAIVYSDDATEADKHWFAELADYVCDGLNECGFIYCPGNIMASNPNWCQSAKQWQQYFEKWVSSPSPQALLNSSVFFDLDVVYGDKTLLLNIKHRVLKMTQQSTLFIAHLSRNAIGNKPPLGFFRDFVLISSGENKSTMDLKHNAIAPIVDLARIYALALGIEENSTLERLQAAKGSHILSKQAGRSLIAAYEFLIQLRLELNALQIQQQKKPSNFLSPKDISRLQRSHLKDAFRVIKELQDSRQVVY